MRYCYVSIKKSVAKELLQYLWDNNIEFAISAVSWLRCFTIYDINDKTFDEVKAIASKDEKAEIIPLVGLKQYEM